MAQIGIHALIGLVGGEQISRRSGYHAAGQAVGWGFLLGSIAPDLDVIAVAGALPFDLDLALALHRSFSHSLAAVVAVLLVSTVLSLVLGERSIRHWGAGMGLGISIHIIMDLLFWFTPIDLLWPASAFGVASPVDLWTWWETPLLLGRLLAAGEFAAMGLYFGVLASRATAQRTPAVRIAAARRMLNLSLGYSLVLVVAAFLLPMEGEGIFRLMLLLPMALVSLPALLYLTWSLRKGLLVAPRTAPAKALAPVSVTIEPRTQTG